MPLTDHPTHAERLWVPAWWWAVATPLAVSLIVALGVYLPPWLAFACAVFVVALVAAALLWFGSTRVQASDAGLLAGRARIEWPFVGKATALTAAQTRARLGTQADAAALLVVRPYLPRAVEVAVADTDDPHPYWLISSRHPERLAAAVNARVTTGAPAGRAEQ